MFKMQKYEVKDFSGAKRQEKNVRFNDVENDQKSLCPPKGAYVPEGLMTSCSWDYMTFTPSVRSYTMLLFTFVFFIPLFVIIFCYCCIFRAIRHTTRLVLFMHTRTSMPFMAIILKGLLNSCDTLPQLCEYQQVSHKNELQTRVCYYSKITSYIIL